MEFQILDILQDLYDKELLSFEDYYALGRKNKISFEEMEQQEYDYKPLRQLRSLPISTTESCD